MKDIVEQGKKYDILIIIVGLSKYKIIIRNLQTVWNEPEDLGSYDNLIAAKDTEARRRKLMTDRKKSMRNI